MQSKKGFTLIEVIVVTLIIAALALLVAPSFKNSTVTNDMEKAKMGLIEYTNAVKLYNEVNPNDTIGGVFWRNHFLKLTSNDGDNNLVYLQNAQGRWVPGSGTLYTFLGLDCVFGFGPSFGHTYAHEDNILSMAMCYFPKYNDEEGKDCYWFMIKKDDPLVIKKSFREQGGDCAIH